MGLELTDFRRYVVQPTLHWLSPEIPYSLGAERLLIGTAIHESGLRWLDQTTPGPGPALGVFQMEAATHFDLWSRFLEWRPALAHKVKTLRAPAPSALDQLRTNLAYACAMSRVLYYRAPEAMPDVRDVDGLASLAKLRFNTIRGKATVEDYRQSLLKTEALYA